MLRLPKFHYHSPTNWTLGLFVLVCIVGFVITVKTVNTKRMPRNLVLQKTHILTMLDEYEVPPEAIIEFPHADQTYYGWIGHATPHIRITRRFRVSGTGLDVYVFNQEGILVDFTRDIEDHPTFKSTWILLYAHYIANTDSISVADLRQRFLDPAVPVQ